MTSSIRMVAVELTLEDLEREARAEGLCLPIEQTAAWARYEATVDGRSPWGAFRILCDGDPVAYVSLIDYQTHGYHYLRASHGPVWLHNPSPEEERAALDAIRSVVRKRGEGQAFVRCCVDADLGCCEHALSIVPYDTTVVIDVTGGEEQILARMKARGRRDVRKALREAPIICADETELAARSFSEYYDVLCETGARDGFRPAPASDYEDMLRILGPEHCRLYAGRDAAGRVVTWSLATVSGSRATRYYAASATATMRRHVTDKLLYFECCELGRFRGGSVTSYDLMAIGSSLCPSLLGLNEFKTKFAREVTHVAPDRDYPIRKAFYRSLVVARKAVVRLRDLRRARPASRLEVARPAVAHS